MITALHVNAQTEGYYFTAAVKAVDSSGFYNIVLTPQINAHVKTGYSDLRIVNDSGKWVPHLVRFPYGEVTNDPVVWERKILRKLTSVWQTEILVESDQTNISNLVFTLKNAVTNRYCTLSGSDDGESWFTINDSISIVTTQKNVASESDFELLFPPVDYKYFKIIIKNWGRESLNIIRAGTKGIVDYPGRIKLTEEVQNPVGNVIQKDSGNISYIRVVQPAAYHFEKIALQLKENGVKNYNRKAVLYIPNSAAHSFANLGLLVSSFNVSNNSTLQTKFAETNAGTFYILIYNDDNLPLKIAEVKTFTQYRVATVYLNRAENYRLMLGNTKALMPAYDLNLNSIPFKEKIATVAVGNISATNSKIAEAPPKNNSTKLIWFAIAVAAIVLVFFTYRLVIDMNKKNADI
jgi:hypothetical protein